MRSKLWENTEMADPALPINVFHTRFAVRDFLRLHWHEHFELVYVESGEAVYQIGGKPAVAKAGDMLFINSGELHAASLSDTNAPATIYAIVFNPSMLGLKEPNIVDLVAPYTSGLSMIANRIGQQDEAYPLILRAFMQLVVEFESKPHGFEMAIRSYCQLLFALLSRHYTVKQRSGSETAAFRAKTERFKALFSYLETHYMDRVSVEQAAAIVHMSEYHFCRMFKKMTGQTFVQFTNLYRINKAEQLLAQTSLSITEIAAEVGCSSINSFSKLFRQLKGVSPRDVRRDSVRG